MRCARVSRVHRTVERLTSCEGSVSVGGRGAVARTTLPLHCVHSIAEQVLRRPRRRPCEPDAGPPAGRASHVHVHRRSTHGFPAGRGSPQI
jgi:hypothetical protein